MMTDSARLMAEALKVAKLNGNFSPCDIGARIGLNRQRSEAAARALSNAGVLVLGFDCAAHFSPDYRKANAVIKTKVKGVKPRGKSSRRLAPTLH